MSTSSLIRTPDRTFGPPTGAATLDRPPAATASATLLQGAAFDGSWGQRLMANHGPKLERAFEVLPGALALFCISALFWGPLLMPWPLAFGIVLFDLYWFSRSYSAAFHAVQGYWRMRGARHTNWRAEYEKALDDGKVLLPWERVHHVVIIPNLNELPEKLHATVEHLANQGAIAHQMTVVLAMEAKEAAAAEKAGDLIREFDGRFGHIFATYHPADIVGEVPGKSSNEAWAGRRAKELLVDRLGYDLDAMTISSCDADSLFPPSFFDCLTFKFCTEPNRHRRFWQGPIFMYNNIWEVPMPIRVVSVLSSLNTLADLCKSHRQVFPHSTYTLSMRMADEVGYWDTDIIPEDWHMFLKCFFQLGGTVEVEPIYLPIGCDGVKAATYKGSLVMRYKQAKRHAWGAADIAYAMQQCLLHPEIPVTRRLRRTWGLVENHLLWSTHVFVLSLGGMVPTFLAPQLKNFTPAMGLDPITSLLLTACMGPFVIFIVLDMLVRPKPGPHIKPWFPLVTLFQWPLIIITSALFSSFPALDAQIQLLRGKPLVYEVTEKV